MAFLVLFSISFNSLFLLEYMLHLDLLNKEYVIIAQLSSNRGRCIFSLLPRQLMISISNVV